MTVVLPLAPSTARWGPRAVAGSRGDVWQSVRDAGRSVRAGGTRCFSRHFATLKESVMRDAQASHTFPPQLLGLLIALTLGWGLNWPMMKLAVAEMAPMRFRTMCLLAGIVGLFATARAGGSSTRVPAGQWPRLAAIA